MTTDIAVRETNDIVITSEQVEIIKNTVCKEATAAEMQLYFYDCKRRGVHPLDRLLHFTKRSGKYTPITSIDLFYIKAHGTGEFAGQDETVFEGQPGMANFKATVRVYRQKPGKDKAGWSATARWSEYFPGDQLGFMWKKMPNRMLEKCAEALALRKAFPSELQGLYVKEEMEQADADSSSAQSAQSASNGTSKPAAAPAQPKGKAVLDKMKKPEAPAAPPASQAPATENTQYDAAWLSQVIDCEDFLRGTQQGTATLRSIRAGFNLENDMYPIFTEQQAEYLTTLKSAVKRMEKR